MSDESQDRARDAINVGAGAGASGAGTTGDLSSSESSKKKKSNSAKITEISVQSLGSDYLAPYFFVRCFHRIPNFSGTSKHG